VEVGRGGEGKFRKKSQKCNTFGREREMRGKKPQKCNTFGIMDNTLCHTVLESTFLRQHF